MINIEGDCDSIIITVLDEVENGGFKGLSATITKQELIDKLIDEGILKDGETV